MASWEIWKLTSPLDGHIIDRENFGDDAIAAKQRFSEIEQARKPGTWELRRDGVYVALFSITPPLVPGRDDTK